MNASTVARTWLFMLAMLCVFSASAEAPRHVDVPTYLQYLTDLRASLQDGKPKPMSDNEWRLFDQAEATARAVLADQNDIDSLPTARKAELYAAQDAINAVLSGQHDERVICRREGRTGSHLKQTHCVSVTQRRLELENARRMIRDQALVSPMTSWEPLGTRPGTRNSLP